MGMELEDGSRVGVIGGGPAGSLFAYFLLTFADRLDLKLHVDIYEPRDFTLLGSAGCNMCGGIVSESLVQALAVEGIDLPEPIVQRGIDSYVLHTDESSIRIDTPLQEKRIAALHRGGGPRDASRATWGGLDGYLLGLAKELGANVVRARVGEVAWVDERPAVRLKESTESYDLLVGATGVNSSAWELFESLGLTYRRPETTKAYITELNLGDEAISRHFGNSMHIFMLDLPRIDCAAIVPKGEYVTVCLLGTDIDRDLVNSFFEVPVVSSCFPENFDLEQGACHCAPKINVREAEKPFMDRVVLIGDCGVTRLYKDGIGAAYRTAKTAARTAAFSGVSEADFNKYYWQIYRSIAGDNRYGRFTFGVVHWIKALPPLVRGVVKMTGHEQRNNGAAKRMSTVLWDMFTGSADYREVFLRTVDPRFLMRFGWDSVRSLRKPAQSMG